MFLHFPQEMIIKLIRGNKSERYNDDLTTNKNLKQVTTRAKIIFTRTQRAPLRSQYS